MIDRNIKELFPILNRTIYGKRLVYFDNGATTQKPKQVIDRIVQSYEQEIRMYIEGYTTSVS